MKLDRKEIEIDITKEEQIMAYKKPKMVAKSSAKKSYVAGCPVQTVSGAWGCDPVGATCCEINRKE